MNTKQKMYVITHIDPGWKIFLSRDDDLIPVDENAQPIPANSILIAVNQREMRMVRSMIKDIEYNFWFAQSREESVEKYDYDVEFDRNISEFFEYAESGRGLIFTDKEMAELRLQFKGDSFESAADYILAVTGENNNVFKVYY